MNTQYCISIPKWKNTAFLKLHITLDQINLESMGEDNKLFVDVNVVMVFTKHTETTQHLILQ
jgi:hypothetical protein